MKKIIVVFLFTFITNSFAQETILPKGTAKLGGVIAFSHNSFKKGFNTIFRFSLGAGYFFINNLCTCLSLDYTYNSSDEYMTTNSYGFGPFVRYYFGLDKLMPFWGISYSYSQVKIRWGSIMMMVKLLFWIIILDRLDQTT